MTAAAALAATFNLVCSVHFTTGTASQPHQIDLSVQHIIRVDRIAGKWCEGDCDQIKAIASVSDSELVLANDGIPGVRDFKDYETVNRMTGDFFEVSGIPGDVITSGTGTCEPAPFSGFSTPKF